MDLPLTDVLPSAEEMPSWREASYVASRYVAMVTDGRPVLTGAFEALAEAGVPARGLPLQRGQGPHRRALGPASWPSSGCPTRPSWRTTSSARPAMERLLDRLKAEYPDSVEEVLRYAPSILQVMPETMEEFLAAVRSEYGGYDALAGPSG